MAADGSGSPGECTLRPARIDDLDRLAEIDAACFPAGIAYPRNYLRDLLCAPTSVTRVAMAPAFADDPVVENPLENPLSVQATDNLNATIVGFAVLEIRRRALTVVGELVTIDVLANARRLGVGQLLHASVERAVRYRNGRRIRLQVSVENDVAIRFYEKLGYRKRGRIPRYYLGKMDAWWMEKVWE